MIYFPTIILNNIAVMVYIKRKLNLQYNSQRWLQLGVVLAMILELAYRISVKVGYSSEKYSWTDNLYLCYFFFTFYTGLPYAIHASILVLTLECVFLTFRNEEYYTGIFSKKMMKFLLAATWIICLTWSALELYAMGDGIFMKRNSQIEEKYTCYLEKKTSKVTKISFIMVTWLFAVTIASATIALVIQLIRRPTLREAYLSCVLANCSLLALDLPFFVTNTHHYYRPGVVKRHVWYGTYFFMKSAYLTVPLLWILKSSFVLKCCRNPLSRLQGNEGEIVSRKESRMSVPDRTSIDSTSTNVWCRRQGRWLMSPNTI